MPLSTLTGYRQAPPSSHTRVLANIVNESLFEKCHKVYLWKCVNEEIHDKLGIFQNGAKLNLECFEGAAKRGGKVTAPN